MRLAATLITALLGLCGPAAAQGDPFFEYHAPRPPIAGDCDTIAAEFGPGATWVGEFAGRRYDDFDETYQPFSARGCFPSEQACRIWQGRATTYLGRGPIVYTRCTAGLNGNW